MVVLGLLFVQRHCRSELLRAWGTFRAYPVPERVNRQCANQFVQALNQFSILFEDRMPV